MAPLLQSFCQAYRSVDKLVFTLLLGLGYEVDESQKILRRLKWSMVGVIFTILLVYVAAIYFLLTLILR